ncbi:YczE/YyaS/YitT family protein [Niallia endozanthoxylica]|uniref:BCR, YitT family protein n=1 Tax=Niallia endozanthoxylica TaxID=2036016 RepID=A0A5J5HSK1_9BACI|nr:DUF6198 family protein [Niallia endozanthoxylica]KAA9023856.1 BCR, YitT family protein [Niallia endozanthoxylica]
MLSRIAIYLVGLAINALGIALTIFSAAGVGSWDAAAIGMNNYFGLTIGTWTVAIQVLIVLMTKVVERKRFQYGSMLAIILRSIFLDLWIFLLFDRMEIPSSFLIQWLVFLFGTLAIGVGIGIYIEAKFPKSPVDGLMLALHNRFDWSINVSRIVVELTGTLLGFILSGPVGLGTLIIALFVGKIIQTVNSKVKMVLNQERMTVFKERPSEQNI